MRVVIDASVAVKWFIPDPALEPNHDKAIVLLQAVIEGRLVANQPIHYLPEIAAVLARIAPERAAEAVGLAQALELSIIDEPDILQRATQLAIDLNHHLFDTLYHAVALATDGILITADERYYRKAQQLGNIQQLADWTLVMRKD